MVILQHVSEDFINQEPLLAEKGKCLPDNLTLADWAAFNNIHALNSSTNFVRISVS